MLSDWRHDRIPFALRSQYTIVSVLQFQIAYHDKRQRCLPGVVELLAMLEEVDTLQLRISPKMRQSYPEYY